MFQILTFKNVTKMLQVSFVKISFRDMDLHVALILQSNQLLI